MRQSRKTKKTQPSDKNLIPYCIGGTGPNNLHDRLFCAAMLHFDRVYEDLMEAYYTENVDDMQTLATELVVAAAEVRTNTPTELH